MDSTVNAPSHAPVEAPAAAGAGRAGRGDRVDAAAPDPHRAQGAEGLAPTAPPHPGAEAGVGGVLALEVCAEFTGTPNFDAYHRAEAFLVAHGFSVGRMQGAAPIGIKYGAYNIQKWHNLRPSDRAALDGVISGDKRNGPVRIKVTAPTREIAQAMRNTLAADPGHD